MKGTDTGIFSTDAARVRWYHYLIHLGYYIPHWVGFFFNRPFKPEKKRDLDILDKVSTLLDSDTTEQNLAYCNELIRLHRIVENTRARRRLEKWSLRVIATYLITVLCIVLCNYVSARHNLFGLCFDIPPTIMITILSTTTVNIIGLGLIVLRGHFLANDKSNEPSRKQGGRQQ